MFRWISGGAFNADDQLYVADTGNERVIQFGPKGAFVRQFGRWGEGPGEFDMLTDLVVLNKGDVVASDGARHVLLVFASDGSPIRVVRYSDADGSMTQMASGAMSRVYWLSESMGDDSVYMSIYQHTLQRRSVSRLVTRFGTDLPVIEETDGAIVGYTRQYALVPRLGVLPDGVIVLQRDEDYVLRLLGPNGETIRRIVGPIRARRVTRRDQEAWYERAGWDPVEGGIAYFAERMSVITGLLVDPTGRIWVRRRGADGAEGGPIDLLTDQGDYIGTITDQGLPFAVSRSGLAAYLERDELDVERIVVRKLPLAWRWPSHPNNGGDAKSVLPPASWPTPKADTSRKRMRGL